MPYAESANTLETSCAFRGLKAVEATPGACNKEILNEGEYTTTSGENPIAASSDV
jgi:hypothetical protein